MWRVVRVRRADGTTAVTVDEGEGRSAYVSKDLESVKECIRRKKLGRALKHGVSAEVARELHDRAAAWDRLSAAEKGLLYCEVYGEEGVSSAVEEVQLSTSPADDDTLFSDAC